MKNQRALITKRLLKEGLLRLLKTNQLDKITITELCQASGINRVTFYNHYSTPREILNDMENDLVADLCKNYPFPLSISEAAAYLEDIFTYLQKNSHIVKVLIKYNTNTVLTQFTNDMAQHFQSLKNPSLDCKSDDTYLSVTFVGSGIYFLLSQWICKDIDKTPEEIVKLVFSIINTHH